METIANLQFLTSDSRYFLPLRQRLNYRYLLCQPLQILVLGAAAVQITVTHFYGEDEKVCVAAR